MLVVTTGTTVVGVGLKMEDSGDLFGVVVATIEVDNGAEVFEVVAATEVDDCGGVWGGSQRCPASDWLENSQKMKEMPFGKC